VDGFRFLPEQQHMTVIKYDFENNFTEFPPLRYTLVVKEKSKADRLAQSLPPALTKTEKKSRRRV